MKPSAFRYSILPAALLCGGALSAIPTIRAQDTASGDQNAGGRGVDRIIVTAGPLDRSAFDSAQSVSDVSGRDLKLKAASTLGETLDGEPGISGSGFTAGASRPIIRGLGDNRVRVLNNGTEVFDVSNLSPDHVPSVDPLLSQAVEVVRGPAILYGSSAIGGVVNVLDNRIPIAPPANGSIGGEFVGRMGYADFERSGAGSLDIALGKHFVLHIDGSRFYTDDVMVPGYALTGRIRRNLASEQPARGDNFNGDPVHYVPNTYTRTKDVGIGLSYVTDKGYIGASFGQFLSTYGVPDDPEVDDPTQAAAPVRLDVTKRQGAIRGSLADPFPCFSAANLKVSYTDYKHLEIDGGEVGSIFKTNGVDARLEFVHKPLGLFEGSVGTQVFYKHLSITGADAFLQPTDTVQPAGFIFEEVRLFGGKAEGGRRKAEDGSGGGKNVVANVPSSSPDWSPSLRLQFGGRVEYNDVNIDSNDPALTSLLPGKSTQRQFVPLSASGGLVYEFVKDTALAVTLSYSERAPTSEELYARGPHDATFQYLVGDPNLGKEKQMGIDVSLRRRAGIVTGSLSGFYNRFYDFIDFTPTGNFIDDLRVFDYTPKEADFYGGEALVDVHLLPSVLSRPAAAVADGKSVRSVVAKEAGGEEVSNPNDLFLEFKGDYVHAEDRESGQALPRITPLRFGMGLGYTSEHWVGKIEGVRVNHQDATAQFETSTPGYTLLNASVSYGFKYGPQTYEVFLRGTNLTNEEARNHESFLKDVLPLPGRNVIGGVRVTF